MIRRSGSGLCWGATRRGIAGWKLTAINRRAGGRVSAPALFRNGHGSYSLLIAVDFPCGQKIETIARPGRYSAPG